MSFSKWNRKIHHWGSIITLLPVDIPVGGFTSLDGMKLSPSAPGQALHELTAPSRNDFKEAKLGIIEEGAWADLLICKGDPTKDVKLILKEDNLILIMKDGKLFKNLTVPPSDPSYRGNLRPSGHDFSLPPVDSHSWSM